jgi:hypothetical protein
MEYSHALRGLICDGELRQYYRAAGDLRVYVKSNCRNCACYFHLGDACWAQALLCWYMSIIKLWYTVTAQKLSFYFFIFILYMLRWRTISDMTRWYIENWKPSLKLNIRNKLAWDLICLGRICGLRLVQTEETPTCLWVHAQTCQSKLWLLLDPEFRPISQSTCRSLVDTRSVQCDTHATA